MTVLAFSRSDIPTSGIGTPIRRNMAEGLKIVNEIYERARVQRSVSDDAYLGIDVAVLILSDPVNADLFDRVVAYCKEEKP